jgi:hypothetical protein
VPGALAAEVALAPVVGDAPESDGDGAGLLGVGDGDGLLGVGDGDVDTGGPPLTVGLGVGFALQLGDGCEDGPGEDGTAATLPLDDGVGT